MKEFIATFQLSKTKLFNVSYYTLSTNKSPYFTTSADEFCRSKRDFSRCGQCQDTLLKGYPTAMGFYKRWNPMHLKQLTDEQYEEMRKDLVLLKAKYNCLLMELDETQRPYSPRFGFYSLVEFSKQPPK